MEIAEKLESFFILNDLRWKLKDGSKYIPTAEDLQQALDKLAEELDNEEEQTQIEYARLIAKKRAGHIDIFVWIGDLNDDTD